MKIKFEDEQGVDEGGLFRNYVSQWTACSLLLPRNTRAVAWFTHHVLPCSPPQMSELGVLLSSRKYLLIAGPDGALLPRARSATESPAEREAREMELFAVGRLMGVALIKRVPLPVCLSRSMYKVFLGERITAFDVARIDPR